MTRYFYHAESDSLFTEDDDVHIESMDPLVEEIDERKYRELEFRQSPIGQMTLEQLIDEVMTSGRYYALRVFNPQVMGHDGYMVSLCRDHVTCTVDQLNPEAKPSEKMRQVLLTALMPRQYTIPTAKVEMPSEAEVRQIVAAETNSEFEDLF